MGVRPKPDDGAARQRRSKNSPILDIHPVFSMMTRPIPEVHVGLVNRNEPELPLAADDVLRYVWHGKFGDMLLEVREGHPFVNGEAVEPALPDLPP